MNVALYESGSDRIGNVSIWSASFSSASPSMLLIEAAELSKPQQLCLLIIRQVSDGLLGLCVNLTTSLIIVDFPLPNGPMSPIERVPFDKYSLILEAVKKVSK